MAETLNYYSPQSDGEQPRLRKKIWRMAIAAWGCIAGCIGCRLMAEVIGRAQRNADAGMIMLLPMAALLLFSYLCAMIGFVQGLPALRKRPILGGLRIPFALCAVIAVPGSVWVVICLTLRLFVVR